MIVEEEVYLEHYGKQGMRWGVRTAKTVGRGTKSAAKSVGRGAKKTVKFAKEHPKLTASVVAGAGAAAIILSKKGKTKVNSPTAYPFKASGKGWVTEARDGKTFDTLISNMSKQKSSEDSAIASARKARQILTDKRRARTG